jgi:hypothetical protein
MSITPEAKMRKYLLLSAASAAIALTLVSGLNTHRQAFSAHPDASISVHVSRIAGANATIVRFYAAIYNLAYAKKLL